MHYSDVIMSTMASQTTGVSTVYSNVCSGADQRKHQSSVVTGLCVGNSPWLVNSPHKGLVTWKLFPSDDVIMCTDMPVMLHIISIVKRSRRWVFSTTHYFGPVTGVTPLCKSMLSYHHHHRHRHRHRHRQTNTIIIFTNASTFFRAASQHLGNSLQ